MYHRIEDIARHRERWLRPRDLGEVIVAHGGSGLRQSATEQIPDGQRRREPPSPIGTNDPHHGRRQHGTRHDHEDIQFRRLVDIK